MIELRKRIFQRQKTRFAVLGLILLGLLFIPGPQMARACWNPQLTECFDQPPPDWPWGQWQVASNLSDRWGVQTRYYDIHICPSDIRACWILGQPSTNDPSFVPYPPNLDTYVTWGPLNLATAQAAGASFWLLNYSEPAHDSIFWGASLSRQLTSQNMMVAGVYSGDMVGGWELKYTDLAQLRAPNGDTISYLGQGAVYLFWRFRSDGNENPPDHQPLRFGSIIDNVSVSVDDGGLDLRADATNLLNLDTTQVVTPGQGDTVMASFDWSTCNGGGLTYPPFHIIGRVDTTVILDTVTTGISQGEGHRLYSHPWVLTPDSHTVRFMLDSLGEVNETDETNNAVSVDFYVPVVPHVVFQWITSGDSTVYADQTVTLRWEAFDTPAYPATLLFGSNADGALCQGPLIPNGVRPVDGLDSLVWNITQYSYGARRHVFVRWTDGINDTCFYAPFVVIRQAPNSAEAEAQIPERFHLEQNYPNPFNPSTELQYGIARQGHVRLVVTDLLGREVAVLVNGERSAGTYTALFDGAMLPSGLYFYTLTSPEGKQTRKMMLMK